VSESIKIEPDNFSAIFENKINYDLSKEEVTQIKSLQNNTEKINIASNIGSTGTSIFSALVSNPSFLALAFGEYLNFYRLLELKYPPNLEAIFEASP